MKKFSTFLLVLLLALVSSTASAQSYPRGDVDQDGAVNISDLSCLIDYLLSGTWPDDPVTPPDEGDWVDLGLPSGTLWATRNVGASAPEDYGDYFAWGETAPKDYYDWSNYKWCNGSELSITKYCTDSSYGYNGFTDGKTELDPEDDAAYVNWGSVARMPSMRQIQELCYHCTWQWTQRNGVNGQLGTGPNGNTIFLPAAGYHWSHPPIDAGSWGIFWSRMLVDSEDYSYKAYCLYIDSENNVSRLYEYRYFGFPVRAVRVSQN